ncbi:MAG: rod shape-determining protein MreD [Vicinamibacterales bacterium]
MRALAALGGLVGAVLAQTAVAGLVTWRETAVVDLVLVVVVYVALVGGPVAGLLAGTVGGLIQDALSSGILGIGGLAKTIVGFLVGRFGTQFVVSAALPQMLTFAAATAAHAVVYMGLYTLLGLRSYPDALTVVAAQAVGNGVAGAIVFHLGERIPRALDRRRASRGMRVSR